MAWYEPTTTSATPTEAAMKPRSANGRNCRVRTSMTVSAIPVGATSRVIWRRKWANAMASSRRPAKTSEEPALDPDAGGQPAPEVHVRSSSRWKTATGPKSCSRSHAATSSATTIERWKPPVQPMPMVRRVLPSAM